MRREDLFHGAPGDSILGILETGHIRPGSDGTIYFSRFEWEPTIQYGADLRRGASFAIGLTVEIPDAAVVQRQPKGGVRNALMIVSAVPLRATVKQLFVREPRGHHVAIIAGADAIEIYLRARQGPKTAD